MTPIFQTRYGDPEGNCTEACLATMVGCELDEVPDLFKLSHPPGGRHWFIVLDEWLATRGLALVQVQYDGPGTPFPAFTVPGVPVIAGGPAKANGVAHYCVMESGTWKLLHDPHEGWEGITAVEDVLFLTVRP